MNRLTGVNRFVSLLVLGLSLHAVVPATNYNARLEAFNPTSIPHGNETGNRTSTPQPIKVRSTRLQVSPDFNRSRANEPRLVHAVIPIYQKTVVVTTSQPSRFQQIAPCFRSHVRSVSTERGPPVIA